MLADYFTKPLQGIQFYTLRDHIMNIDPSSPYHSGHRSVLGIDHPGVSSPVGHPEVSTPQNPVVEDDHITDVLTTDVTPEDRRSYRDVLIG